MHTFEGTTGTKFKYNLDFSGNILITNSCGEEVEIPCIDFLEAIGEFVRREKIKRIEKATVIELLYKT